MKLKDWSLRQEKGCHFPPLNFNLNNKYLTRLDYLNIQQVRTAITWYIKCELNCIRPYTNVKQGLERIAVVQRH